MDKYPWTDDESGSYLSRSLKLTPNTIVVLTWISIYWFSRAGPAASIRIYYEFFQHGGVENFYLPLNNVPLGLSSFPADISNGRKLCVPFILVCCHSFINLLHTSWSKQLGKVVFEKEHDKGGHFAAYEKPDLLAGDLREMFGKKGPCYQVVKNATGY